MHGIVLDLKPALKSGEQVAAAALSAAPLQDNT